VERDEKIQQAIGEALDAFLKDFDAQMERLSQLSN
jgi:hypothetical protein